MPIYEFECDACGNRFEELVSSGSPSSPTCSRCGSAHTQRIFSPVSPPSRQPRGAKVREGESRRREREAARGARLAETKRKRKAGEL